jgi:hypothetical protein
MTEVSGSDDPTSVELTIPAGTKYLSAARLVASAVASEHGFSVDDIDELRIAVNEALAVLVDSAPRSATIRLVFDISPDGDLRIAGFPTGGHADGVGDLAVDPLAERILRTVTDSYEFGTSGFVLHKSSSRLRS